MRKQVLESNYKLGTIVFLNPDCESNKDNLRYLEPNIYGILSRFSADEDFVRTAQNKWIRVKWYYRDADGCVDEYIDDNIYAINDHCSELLFEDSCPVQLELEF